MPCHQRQEGGLLVIPPAGSGALLIIVPAFNEEGAIAGVVRSVKEHMPGVPVLVSDDGSVDSTVSQARAAGAEVLALPHHLGLGGCVQTGYKLAYELGFEYVIRIDGDGQHDARDIPRILETLQTTGCEMVIGSRLEVDNSPCTRARAARRSSNRRAKSSNVVAVLSVCRTIDCTTVIKLRVRCCNSPRRSAGGAISRGSN